MVKFRVIRGSIILLRGQECCGHLETYLNVSTAIFEISGKCGAEYTLHDTDYSTVERIRSEYDRKGNPPSEAGYDLASIGKGYSDGVRIEAEGWWVDSSRSESDFCLVGQKCNHPDFHALMKDREQKELMEREKREKLREPEYVSERFSYADRRNRPPPRRDGSPPSDPER